MNSQPGSESSPRREPSALDDLYWQDEILQVMFWLLGEGFAAEVTLSDLQRFLDGDPVCLASSLEALTRMDLLTSGDTSERPHPDRATASYRLTEAGKDAAQQRFVDEFRPLIGRTGHGECSDDCWCHDPDHAGEECPSHQLASAGHQQT